jgi:hypothetical protein
VGKKGQGRKEDNREGMNRPKHSSNTKCYDAKLLRRSVVSTFLLITRD